MLELLKKFEEKIPEVVFEWNDVETGAVGWVVINSLRGGAAGGGTRMRQGLEKSEVVSLAKTMEVKFTVSGPPIGGAKSGINFDPSDPRKRGVLERWYKAVKPLLKYYYGTGGDLNIDEINEVIPVTEDCGVWHPQEGVFKGHFHPSEAQIVNRIGQLRQGVKKIVEDLKYTPDFYQKYTVADMITGFGVAESVSHYYNLWGGELKGKRAVIQGWGNVGSSAAYYLAQSGAKIVGIIDREGGLYNEAGYSFEEIKRLYLNRKGNRLISESPMSYDQIMSEIWDRPFEIFVPAAGSRMVTRDHVERMIKSSTEVISCGANVPFQDPEFFFGSIGEYADEHLSVIPDFIANCGMARVFSYLMANEVKMDDESIFKDVSNTLKEALGRVYEKSPKMNRLSKTAFEIALEQLI
jgi:glutamate dehydrogenase/leucine dehydrogenase